MKRKECIGTGYMKDGVYNPIKDWTMVPGARVSEERIQKLMNFDFEGFGELSIDDIIACNNRKFQAVLWLFADAVTTVTSEEKALKMYYELGYMLGKKGWEGMQKRFNTDRVTPAQVAWYQDMAHFFYGPHCQAYTEYTEDTVVVTRQDCLVSYPPPGMDDKRKFVIPFAEGYLKAYTDIAPYITITSQAFITEEEMEYKIDLTKYPSFCSCKRAGEPFHQLVFKWNDR